MLNERYGLRSKRMQDEKVLIFFNYKLKCSSFYDERVKWAADNTVSGMKFIFGNEKS